MNWRRILVHLAWLAGLLVVVETGTIWVLSERFWTPIQRHYLPAYVWISLPVITPATAEVRLIWKTGRHRKPQLATDDDVVDSVDGTTMVLSQSASNAGWNSIIVGAPRQISADELKQILAPLAFEGQSLSDILLLPELSVLAALCAALCAWFLVIGFIRGLIDEVSWRRRVYLFQEPSPNPFEVCAVFARRFCSELARLHRSATRRIKMHQHESVPKSTPAEPVAEPAMPASFAFPIFGVYNPTSAGYLSNERDEIE